MSKSESSDQPSPKAIIKPLRFTIEETAKILRISKSRLYALCKKGRGPKIHKDGARSYTDAEELRSWYAARREKGEARFEKRRKRSAEEAKERRSKRLSKRDKSDGDTSDDGVTGDRLRAF